MDVGFEKNYIPRRLYMRLKSIYENRITILAAPDGSGKSTYLSEFILRSHPKGFSCRFIRGSRNAEECFSRLCEIITGKRSFIPVSATEQAALSRSFAAAESRENTVVIIDSEYAADMLFNSLRVMSLLSASCKARIVVTAPPLNLLRTMCCRKFGFSVIDESELTLTKEETAEYAALTGVSENCADKVYRLSGGMIMRTRICLYLIGKGCELPQDSADLLSEAFRSILSKEEQIALYTAATFGCFNEELFRELSESKEVSETIGKDLFEPQNLLATAEDVSRHTGLISVNKKTKRIYCHSLFYKMLKDAFNEAPLTLKTRLRKAFAKSYERAGRNFDAFIELYRIGDYENAGRVKSNASPLSLEQICGARDTLLEFVESCPLDCKEIITRYIRLVSLLLLTDKRGAVQKKLKEAAAYISSSEAYSPTEKRALLAYINLHRTHEDFYIIEKMGTHIKRAYELFSGERIEAAPFYSWHMNAPSVFALIHRYSVPVLTEEEQFLRYHKMYTDMIAHGEHICVLYSAEALYFRGELRNSGLSAAAELPLCTEKRSVSARISLIMLSAKVCLFNGRYKEFYAAGKELARIIHTEQTKECRDMARLCLAEIASYFRDMEEEGFFLRCMSDNAVMLNRFQAPFCYFLLAAMDFFTGEYGRVLSRSEKYLQAARDVGNETIEIKMLLLFAAAELKTNASDRAAAVAEQALEKLAGTEVIMPAAEVFIICEGLSDFLMSALPPRYTRYIGAAREAANSAQRGVEVVQTFLLAEVNPPARAEKVTAEYVFALAKEMSAERKRLKLSAREFACAVLAASRYSNAEIASLLNTTEDSVKSCLKRAFAKLNIRSRAQLRSFVPTIKR